MDSLHFDTFGEILPTDDSADESSYCTLPYLDRDTLCATCRNREPGSPLCRRCWQKIRHSNAALRKSTLEMTSTTWQARQRSLQNVHRIDTKNETMPGHEIPPWQGPSNHDNPRHDGCCCELCTVKNNNRNNVSQDLITEPAHVGVVNEDYDLPIMTSVYCRAFGIVTPLHFPRRQHRAANLCRGLMNLSHHHQMMQLTIETIFEPRRPSLSLCIKRWLKSWRCTFQNTVASLSVTDAVERNSEDID
ncbi:hypothetical protein F5Y16DRAFT_390972 [Xylariaceae sp. FL0255]|nr:hypothetical protein F5Y16DRAFT_390972 [Xylariaceae sp. FL0255]